MRRHDKTLSSLDVPSGSSDGFPNRQPTSQQRYLSKQTIGLTTLCLAVCYVYISSSSSESPAVGVQNSRPVGVPPTGLINAQAVSPLSSELVSSLPVTQAPVGQAPIAESPPMDITNIYSGEDPLPPSIAIDYSPFSVKFGTPHEMLGSDFLCNDHGSINPEGACQLLCVDGEACSNARDACENIQGCVGAILGGSPLLATLKFRPDFGRDLNSDLFSRDDSFWGVWKKDDPFWGLWKRSQCENNWAAYVGNHDLFLQDSTRSTWTRDRCRLYMRGDIMANEVVLEKHPLKSELARSDANDFLMGSKNPLVVDIGMHDGSDTEFYLHKGCRVLAAEADSALVEAAKSNPLLLLGEKTGRFNVRNVAISPHQEGSVLPVTPTITFYKRQSNSEWNSITDTSCRGDCVEVTMESKTCAQIVLEASPGDNDRVWYMKVDIEGADVICLKSLAALPKEKVS